MYLFSCPSLFCKAFLDTLFSLSTCIFCPIIKYICKYILYGVPVNWETEKTKRNEKKRKEKKRKENKEKSNEKKRKKKTKRKKPKTK